MAKSYNKRSKTPSSRKKWLLGLLVLLIAGGVAFAVTRPDSSSSDPGKEPTTGAAKKSGKSTVNLNPPTEEQQNAARDTSSQASVTNSDGKKTVTPIITSYDAQKVYAFVDGVIENGGTCTATYTHGGDVVTATSTAVGDVSHTTCRPMTLAGPVNIQGDWSIVVTYSSSTYYGKSEAKTLTVH